MRTSGSDFPGLVRVFITDSKLPLKPSTSNKKKKPRKKAAWHPGSAHSPAGERVGGQPPQAALGPETDALRGSSRYPV